MARGEMIAGLVLAALALSGGEEPLRGAALSEDLDTLARERLREIDQSDDREAALRRLAREAAEAPLRSLPAHPRVASLLAPIASPLAATGIVALPTPRRGYRPAPGLRDHLRRIALGDLRAARAAEEVARVEGRTWPA